MKLAGSGKLSPKQAESQLQYRVPSLEKGAEASKIRRGEAAVEEESGPNETARHLE